MKNPLEKRRPATREEKLHREIARILETKYIDPHSGRTYVHTDVEADAWFSMLSKSEQAWIIELFYSEIGNDDESERDRGDLLDALARWDPKGAGSFAFNYWRNLPVEKNLHLQARIAGSQCLSYSTQIETFMVSRFRYWAKKLFLAAETWDWQILGSVKVLVQIVANTIAYNRFESGLHLLPQCILLTHRHVFDDIRFLGYLTHTFPSDRSSSLQLESQKIRSLKAYLESQDPVYIRDLKSRHQNWFSVNEPLASLLSNLKATRTSLQIV